MKNTHVEALRHLLALLVALPWRRNAFLRPPDLQIVDKTVDLLTSFLAGGDPADTRLMHSTALAIGRGTRLAQAIHHRRVQVGACRHFDRWFEADDGEPSDEIRWHAVGGAKPQSADRACIHCLYRMFTERWGRIKTSPTLSISNGRVAVTDFEGAYVVSRHGVVCRIGWDGAVIADMVFARHGLTAVDSRGRLRAFEVGIDCEGGRAVPRVSPGPEMPVSRLAGALRLIEGAKDLWSVVNGLGQLDTPRAPGWLVGSTVMAGFACVSLGLVLNGRDLADETHGRLTVFDRGGRRLAAHITPFPARWMRGAGPTDDRVVLFDREQVVVARVRLTSLDTVATYRAIEGEYIRSAALAGPTLLLATSVGEGLGARHVIRRYENEAGRWVTVGAPIRTRERVETLVSDGRRFAALGDGRDLTVGEVQTWQVVHDIALPRCDVTTAASLSTMAAIGGFMRLHRSLPDRIRSEGRADGRLQQVNFDGAGNALAAAGGQPMVAVCREEDEGRPLPQALKAVGFELQTLDTDACEGLRALIGPTACAIFTDRATTVGYLCDVAMTRSAARRLAEWLRVRGLGGAMSIGGRVQDRETHLREVTLPEPLYELLDGTPR